MSVTVWQLALVRLLHYFKQLSVNLRGKNLIWSITRLNIMVLAPDKGTVGFRNLTSALLAYTKLIIRNITIEPPLFLFIFGAGFSEVQVC